MDRAMARKTEAKYISPISEAELICRMIEASNGMKRPAGQSAVQALGALPLEDQAAWKLMARAAMEYWRECIINAQRPS